LKFGYERSERLALDISSRADFMHALTYPPDNMPGWCIAGLIASVWKKSPMVPIRSLIPEPCTKPARGSPREAGFKPTWL
jgi:hypothetical protein